MLSLNGQCITPNLPGPSVCSGMIIGSFSEHAGGRLLALEAGSCVPKGHGSRVHAPPPGCDPRLTRCRVAPEWLRGRGLAAHEERALPRAFLRGPFRALGARRGFLPYSLVCGAPAWLSPPPQPRSSSYEGLQLCTVAA